jgi:signal transduction histidine kinase/HPt (histidine-containing phosphotransfer) domain-containing protein
MRLGYDLFGAAPMDESAREQLEGRLAAAFALGRPYLALPFAGFCLLAAPLSANIEAMWLLLPIVLQIAAVTASYRMKEMFERREPAGDPRIWAFRLIALSAFSGASWGLGAYFWFDAASFERQAYLALAFLGLSATEFIARFFYRPAYIAHAAPSLLPLAFMLAFHGEVFQWATALLFVCFAGGLYAYGGVAVELADRGIRLRIQKGKFINRPDSEIRKAEARHDAALDKERGRMHVLSHIGGQLQGPVGTILNMAQMLERSDLAKAQHDHVKMMLEAGKGLKTMLDDVVVLASPEEEDRTGAAEGCDVAQAVRLVVRLLQPKVWEKRLRISVNIPAGVPRVAADARLVRRVLLKLLGNAIRFTDRGAIEVAVTALEDADAGMMRFTITDGGAGIPAHRLSAIFENLDTSGAHKQRGLGTGLAVEKCLIEAVGGTIGAESEPGAGASFWFTIPAIATRALTGEVATTAAPSGLSLLAYLPDGDMRMPVIRSLTPHGNRIVFAETLAEAVAMSLRGHFMAALVPASQVGAFASAPGQRVPILALVPTAESLPAGADHCLPWPASEDELFAAVRAVSSSAEALEGSQGEAAAIDSSAIQALEKSLGKKTLIDILESYMSTSESLAAALIEASARSDRLQAGQIARDIAGAAGGLGLTVLAGAARSLAQFTRDEGEQGSLDEASNAVVSEHRRVHGALRKLYPDLSA